LVSRSAEGLAALSIRRLAAELGVSGPSLNKHFASKDDILDAVVDGIISQVDTACLAQQDWRTALLTWGRSYRAALTAHQNIVPYLAQGPGRRPASLAMADAEHGALIAAGWLPARATHIGAMMRYLVTGSALGSFADGFADGFADDPSLHAHAYPNLHQAHRLAERRPSVDEGAFTLGLEMMIDGLDRLYRQALPPA
jgi:AcrR family transcriptional regulator